jgi:hypothetical protein
MRISRPQSRHILAALCFAQNANGFITEATPISDAMTALLVTLSGEADNMAVYKRMAYLSRVCQNYNEAPEAKDIMAEADAFKALIA